VDRRVRVRMRIREQRLFAKPATTAEPNVRGLAGASLSPHPVLHHVMALCNWTPDWTPALAPSDEQDAESPA
jgi:hypothetical protein